MFVGAAIDMWEDSSHAAAKAWLENQSTTRPSKVRPAQGTAAAGAAASGKQHCPVQPQPQLLPPPQQPQTSLQPANSGSVGCPSAVGGSKRSGSQAPRGAGAHASIGRSRLLGPLAACEQQQPQPQLQRTSSKLSAGAAAVAAGVARKAAAAGQEQQQRGRPAGVPTGLVRAGAAAQPPAGVRVRSNSRLGGSAVPPVALGGSQEPHSSTLAGNDAASPDAQQEQRQQHLLLPPPADDAAASPPAADAAASPPAADAAASPAAAGGAAAGTGFGSGGMVDDSSMGGTPGKQSSVPGTAGTQKTGTTAAGTSDEAAAAAAAPAGTAGQCAKAVRKKAPARGPEAGCLAEENLQDRESAAVAVAAVKQELDKYRADRQGGFSIDDEPQLRAELSR